MVVIADYTCAHDKSGQTPKMRRYPSTCCRQPSQSDAQRRFSVADSGTIHHVSTGQVAFITRSLE